MESIWNAGQALVHIGSATANFAWQKANTAARSASAAYSALSPRVQDGLQGLACAVATPLPLGLIAHAFYKGHCHIPAKPEEYMCGSFGGLVVGIGLPVAASGMLALGTCACFHKALYGRLPPFIVNLNIQGLFTRNPVRTQTAMYTARLRRRD